MHALQSDRVHLISLVSFQLLFIMSINPRGTFMDQLDAKPTRGLMLEPESSIV